MSAKTTTDRKAGSTERGHTTLERLLVVAAVVAVLVSVGAWIAMNRPGGEAEAAGADSSVTSGGTSGDSEGTGTSSATGTDSGTGAGIGTSTGSDTGDQAASSAAPSSSTGSGTPAAGQNGTAATPGRAGTSAAPSSSAPSPLSPTRAFLTALSASGLAPPVDDTQKLAMADDVCQEMGYGSTYADVVRALTFAGATDAEATNFAKLAITNICPQYKIG